VSTLLTVNISAAKKSASASEANIAADSCNLQPTTGAPDRAPPFPSSYYVLTPAEMVENNYPLPVEAEARASASAPPSPLASHRVRSRRMEHPFKPCGGVLASLG